MVKLKTSLTLDGASTIMDSALAHSRAENLLPLTVVVVDAGDKMDASKSEDGSGIMRFGIARGKARGVLGMLISSCLIRDRLFAIRNLSMRYRQLLMVDSCWCRAAF